VLNSDLELAGVGRVIDFGNLSHTLTSDCLVANELGNERGGAIAVGALGVGVFFNCYKLSGGVGGFGHLNFVENEVIVRHHQRGRHLTGVPHVGESVIGAFGHSCEGAVVPVGVT